MYGMMAFAIQEIALETKPTLAHSEAVVRLARIVAAMTALDLQIERCTDPREESCLLTLRVEHEVAYLETLYGWGYEPSESAVVQ